jgi:hypothetical protein
MLSKSPVRRPPHAADKPLDGEAAKILRRLREEGDELETWRAWLEELSEHTLCPVCDIGSRPLDMATGNGTANTAVLSSHLSNHLTVTDRAEGML